MNNDAVDYCGSIIVPLHQSTRMMSVRPLRPVAYAWAHRAHRNNTDGSDGNAKVLALNNDLDH